MKYSYLFFIYLLLCIVACEKKKPESVATLKSVAVKKDSCLVTYVLIVNLPDATYNKKYFRKALAYAIDRKRLFEWSPADYSVDENGDMLPGGPAIHGIVQPVFSEYDIKTIKGYGLNLDSAKHYLKKSKFDFNTHLNVFSGSSGASSESPTATMKVLWCNELGLKYIYQNALSSSELFSKAFSGDKGIYFIPLINHYKEPEKYLSVFYSNNTSNPDTTLKQQVYRSVVFDKFYEAGLNAFNRLDAVNNFKAAEQVLIDDAVIIPLWYGKRVY